MRDQLGRFVAACIQLLEPATGPAERLELGVAYRRLAHVLREDLHARAAALDRSLGVLEELSRRYPSKTAYRHELGCSRRDRAHVLGSLGRRSEALDRLRHQARLFYRSRTQNDPRQAQLQRLFNVGHGAQATAELDLQVGGWRLEVGALSLEL